MAPRTPTQEQVTRAALGIDRERLIQLDRALLWAPMPGRQLEAYTSKVDQLLFGGAAGGSKSDLLIGLALTAHKSSLIVRREGVQLVPVVDRITQILGTRDGYNSANGVWRLPGGRTLRLGGCANVGDEQRYQGAARDFLGVDEAAHFQESQVRFLLGWTRSVDPKQRCRAVFATNPPTSAEGEWIVRLWAPWLDEAFPNRAAPGEPRYVAMLDGAEVWVDGPQPFRHKGELIRPLSRTFIPSKISDNLYLRDSDYVRNLQALPEPLRSQMLLGDFTAGRTDDEYQVIPTAWVKAAMDRWSPRTDPGEVTAVGVDPSRGGDDATVAPRHGWWFAPLIVVKPDATGAVTGGSIARRVLEVAGDVSSVYVDIVGIGASAFDHLEAWVGTRAVAVNGSAGSEEMDRSGHLRFVNMRAAAHWRMRELLDPASAIKVSLPRDARLLADLTAPRYRLTARGIAVESKEDIKGRLGRSPDRGDAVILAATRTVTIRGLNRFTVHRAVPEWR